MEQCLITCGHELRLGIATSLLVSHYVSPSLRDSTRLSYYTARAMVVGSGGSVARHPYPRDVSLPELQMLSGLVRDQPAGTPVTWEVVNDHRNIRKEFTKHVEVEDAVIPDRYVTLTKPSSSYFTQYISRKYFRYVTPVSTTDGHLEARVVGLSVFPRTRANLAKRGAPELIVPTRVEAIASVLIEDDEGFGTYHMHMQAPWAAAGFVPDNADALLAKVQETYGDLRATLNLGDMVRLTQYRGALLFSNVIERSSFKIPLPTSEPSQQLSAG